jgi:uncharacterized protein with GYD domain
VTAVSEALAAAGATLESFHFALGGTDAYVIADHPDNVSAVATALAVTASGGATVRTVVLLTPAEIDAAVARQTTYRPPGG